MTGDIVLIGGTQYEIVWNGEEGLIPERQTKVIGAWEPPKRIYNKTGKYARKPIDNRPVSIDTGIIWEDMNVGRTVGVTGAID